MRGGSCQNNRGEERTVQRGRAHVFVRRDAVLPTIRAAESQAYRDASGSSEAEMARAQWKAAARFIQLRAKAGDSASTMIRFEQREYSGARQRSERRMERDIG
jgi:hypothetical protein